LEFLPLHSWSVCCCPKPEWKNNNVHVIIVIISVYQWLLWLKSVASKCKCHFWDETKKYHVIVVCTEDTSKNIYFQYRPQHLNLSSFAWSYIVDLLNMSWKILTDVHNINESLALNTVLVNQNKLRQPHFYRWNERKLR